MKNGIVGWILTNTKVICIEIHWWANCCQNNLLARPYIDRCGWLEALQWASEEVYQISSTKNNKSVGEGIKECISFSQVKWGL